MSACSCMPASTLVGKLTVYENHVRLCNANRLLARHQEEVSRISDLLAADGSVGSDLAEKLESVRRREEELRATERTRAQLEEKMRMFSEKGGSVMHKLDVLSANVAALEAFRANLSTARMIRTLEDEPDKWLRLQQLAELLESPSSSTALQDTVRVRVNALVKDLRKCLSDDLAAAAKALGWPGAIEIPASVQHATDGMISDWVQASSLKVLDGHVPDKAPKQTQEQRLQRLCRLLARLTSLQLLDLRCQPPKTKSPPDAPDAMRESQGQGAGVLRAGGLYFEAWGVDCLLQALAVRFKFHFQSARKTNRLDKPDWYLSYQLSRLKEHLFFLATIVQTSVRHSAPAQLVRFGFVL